MEDAAGSLSDLVVPLGDFGSNEKIGGVEGLLQAHDFLRRVRAPLRPILGNHDLQRESGNGFQPKGTIERAFLELYGLQTPYGVMEFDDFRLFFISTDPQPADSFYQIQECYVSDKQFDWFTETLRKRRGIPSIVFSHAPPIGCGLRTVPKVHVRATNAYLDQNHDPYRWLRLVQEYPEIVMWFSAHYHLSHWHHDSIAIRYGTAFFTTGVHGSVTRDGGRQSRVIEITKSGIEVYTLDHVKRAVNAVPDWSFRAALKRLVEKKAKALHMRQTPSDKVRSGPFRLLDACPFGELGPLAEGILPLEQERYLVASEDGFLWELDLGAEAVLGTLHLDCVLAGVVTDKEGIWLAWEDKLSRIDSRSMRRFAREHRMEHGQERLKFNQPISCLAPRKHGGVWVACRDKIFEIEVLEKSVGKRVLEPAISLQENILKMVSDENRLWIVTENRELYLWDKLYQTMRLKFDRVVNYDVFQGEFAVLIKENEGSKNKRNLSVFYENKYKSWKVSLDWDLLSNDSGGQIMCLGNERVLLELGGDCFFLDGENGFISLNIGDYEVAAFTRMFHPDPNRFGLGVIPHYGSQRSQLQIWEYRLDPAQTD